MATTNRSVYRHSLPKNCIPFASERGKIIFETALETKYMNCYFRLACQFRTQERPFSSGISSLIMILNAMEVDPGVVWKGVFRWYHEDMFKLSASETCEEQEVNMDELYCLALFNQLDVDMKQLTKDSNISKFREVVKSVTSSDKKAIIASYERIKIGQSGPGHFSPIGGYSEQEDMVLILDVARYKYPAHWISVVDLFSAMHTSDSSFEGGYIVLWKRHEIG